MNCLSLVFFLSLFNCFNCKIICENLGKFELCNYNEGEVLSQSPLKFFPPFDQKTYNYHYIIVHILTLEKYETLARKKCGNSNDGWTYPQIKGCEVSKWSGRKDWIHTLMKERHAEICKKHPNLNYCPPTKKMRKSDFYIYDKLSKKI